MQAKIPFRAKVREVGHVGSRVGFQRAGSPVSSFWFQVSCIRGLGAQFQVSGFTCPSTLSP